MTGSKAPTDRLVCLDLETTGGNATRHRIIEIGLVEVADGRVLCEWRSLVNPGRTIPPFIQQYTGISSEMVSGAPRFEDLAGDLLQRLNGAVLVAHNARFDYGFLKNEFRRLGQGFSAPVLCTVRLSKALYPHERSHSLDAVMARHGLVCERRHRALDDARLLWAFLEKARAEHGAAAVETAMTAQLRRPSLPPGVDPGIAERLPEGPGVYLFYDAHQRLLYVGKSIRLRSRVLSHFSGDHSSHKDMRLGRQLADVRWIETAGELGALLLEASLIKAHAPVHNRRLRRHRELLTWRLDTAHEFHLPMLDNRLASGSRPDTSCFGAFRSRRAARERLRDLCVKNGLCPARCGLEKATGPCFAFQLGRCKGACAGRESALSHNLRLAAALASIRLSAWPFQGPVAIRERDPVSRREALQVVDQWCWFGTASSGDELEALLEGGGSALFDLDVYRILRRWLDKDRRHIEVIPLHRYDCPETSSG